MIKRIISIQNVGRFTSLGAESGNQGEFSKLNVIYARNAEGKSTLCDVLRSLTLNDPSYVIGRKRFGVGLTSKVEILFNRGSNAKAEFSPHGWSVQPEVERPKILIYDERFVLDNVLVGHQVDTSQRRSLFGLVIGAHALALEEQVKAAGEEQTRATNNKSIAERTASDLAADGWTLEAWRKLPAIEGIDDLIRQKEESYQRAKTTALNQSAIKSRASLAVLNLPDVPAALETTLATTLEGTATEALEQVKLHLERHPNVDMDWLKRGYGDGQNAECPYCAQAVSASDVVKLYSGVFNDALRNQQQQLTDLEGTIRKGFGEVARMTLKQCIEKHDLDRSWWKESGGLTFDLTSPPNPEALVNQMSDVEASALAAIGRKRQDPNQAVTLTPTEQAALTAWKASVVELSPYLDAIASANAAIKEHQSGTTTTSLTSLEVELSQLKATKTRHMTTAVDAIARLTAAEQAKAQADNKKRTANEALKKESVRVFTEYGTRINEYLKAFGVEFRIERTGVNFTGGQPSGEIVLALHGHEIKTSATEAADPSKPSLSNTLSSGDKSTLALAYFLSMLDGETAKANSVVVFDDPFHGQDSSRRQRTIESIKDVASIFGQTLVLSHDLDFAREVERIHVDGVRSFILRHKGHSSLSPVDFPSLATKPHIKDYLTLEEFAANPSNDDDRCRTVVRAMRQALEGYYRVKYPSQFNSKDYLGDMVGKIRDAQPDSPLAASKAVAESLGQVNDYSKTHYHSDMDSNPIDSAELLSYTRQALSIIHR